MLNVSIHFAFRCRKVGEVGMTEFIITCQSELQKDGSYKIERYRELIRCKDCRYGNVKFNGIVLCSKGGMRKPDWFCADGERRTGDG